MRIGRGIHFGCKSDDDSVLMRPREQAAYPGAQTCIALAHRRQRRTCTLDKYLTQVTAAALGDAEQPRLAAGGGLTWDQAQPCSKIATTPKGPGIADGSDQCGRVEGTDAGNGQQAPRPFVGLSCFWELGVEVRDPLVKRYSAGAHVGDEPVDARPENGFFGFEHLAEPNR